MINGAERSTEGSGDAGLLFVHLMQAGSHYLQPLQPVLLSSEVVVFFFSAVMRGRRGWKKGGKQLVLICLTPTHHG